MKLISLLALALAGLVGATTADAETFCVKKAGCVGTQKATIQEALVAAEQNNITDTVQVGTNGGAPFVEQLSYTDAAEVVHIVGDGVDQTILEAPPAASATVILLSPGSSIEGMSIEVPDVTNGIALRWNATASEIKAVHSGSTATDTIGMQAEGGAVLEDSLVSVHGLGPFRFINPSGAKIVRSTISGSGGGVSATGSGSFAIEQTNVFAGSSGIQYGGPITGTITDTLVRRTGSAFGYGGISLLGGAKAVVRHATIVGAGGGGGIVVVSSPISNATATIFDTIIDGFEFGLRCLGEPGHPATLGISYSDWTDPTQLTDPECDETLGSGNLSVEPSFVSSGGLIPVYRLKAPSALIDAGDPADPLAVDFAGAPRKVDGDGVGGARSDIGAYEYQRQTPTAKAAAAPEAVAIGESVAFSSSGSHDPDPGDALTYSWDFGDGGSSSSASAQHSFASGGTKKVTLTVTDPTGLQATATATVRVIDSGGGGGGGEGDGGGGGDGDGDELAAKISKLRAVPKRITRGKGAPKLLAGKRRGIQFKVSSAARVTLKLARCKGRIGCRKRVGVHGAASFSAPRGASTIRFRGRFSGRRLAAARYRATLIVAGGNRASALIELLP